MKEKGRIVEAEDNTATVEIVPSLECTKCSSCGAGKPRRITLNGARAKGLKVGDRVEIDIDTSSMMKVYLLLYGAPLAAFAVGIFLIYGIWRSPVASLIGAMIATAIVYMAVGIYIKYNTSLWSEVTVKKTPS